MQRTKESFVWQSTLQIANSKYFLFSQNTDFCVVSIRKTMPTTLTEPGRGTTMPKAALETDYSKFGRVFFTWKFSDMFFKHVCAAIGFVIMRLSTMCCNIMRIVLHNSSEFFTMLCRVDFTWDKPLFTF